MSQQASVSPDMHHQNFVLTGLNDANRNTNHNGVYACI